MIGDFLGISGSIWIGFGIVLLTILIFGTILRFALKGDKAKNNK
jgi:hypothetical protein